MIEGGVVGVFVRGVSFLNASFEALMLFTICWVFVGYCSPFKAEWKWCAV